MSDNTALANQEQKPKTGMTRVKEFMLSPDVKSRFTDMMGRDALYYLNQVLIVVANNPALQECEPQSILVAAMRAASLKLSLDQSQKQAWLIPYGKKAQLQLGYRGIYELAMRTGAYRFINTFPVFEGETLTEDRMTGMHDLKPGKKSDKIIAWCLYFRLNNGFEKTFAMTVDEIEAHAVHYSQGYKKPSSLWHDPVERPKMEKKTVLSNGLNQWGIFNPGDKEIIAAIESDDGTLPMDDADITVQAEPAHPVPATPQAIIDELMGAPVKTVTIPPEPEFTEPLYTAEEIAWAENLENSRGTKLVDFTDAERQRLYMALNNTDDMTDGQKNAFRAIKILLGLPQ